MNTIAGSEIHIRLSLDGTNIGRQKVLVFGYEILNDSLKSTSTRPIGLCFCDENYHSIKRAFSVCIDEIKATPNIQIDGQNVSLVAK